MYSTEERIVLRDMIMDILSRYVHQDNDKYTHNAIATDIEFKFDAMINAGEPIDKIEISPWMDWAPPYDQNKPEDRAFEVTVRVYPSNDDGNFFMITAKMYRGEKDRAVAAFNRAMKGV